MVYEYLLNELLNDSSWLPKKEKVIKDEAQDFPMGLASSSYSGRIRLFHYPDCNNNYTANWYLLFSLQCVVSIFSLLIFTFALQNGFPFPHL